MQFGKMINRSLKIAWQYKSLWIFGLFATGGNGSFNFDSGDSFGGIIEGDNRIFGDGSGGNFFGSDFPFSFNQEMALPLVLTIVAFVLVLMACHLIAAPALIDAVNKITRGGQYRFEESFSRGIDFLGRFLGILLLTSLLAFGSVLIVVLLAIALASISKVLLIPFILLLIPTIIAAGFFLFHTIGLGQVAMVARDCTITQALSEGWQLVKSNIGNCVLMTLIAIGLSMAVGIGMMLIALFTFLPINLLVSSLTGSLIITIILGVIFGLPVSLVIGGMSGTFFNAFYVQFYFQLVEPQPAATLPPDTAPDAGLA